MSYDAAPAFDALRNDEALDARSIEAAFEMLSEMARCLAGDLLGNPGWLAGGEVTGTQSGNDLFATVAAGDWYVQEEGSLTHRGVRVATRSRQADRSIQVDQGTDRLLSFQPNTADDRLAALIQTDAHRVRPPEGAAPIAWCGVGFSDLPAVIDARQHPVYGALVDVSGAQARSRKVWVPITDGKLAVVLYPGEQLEVSLAVTAKDGLVAAFVEKDFIAHDRYDMTQVLVSLNGEIVSETDLLGSALGVAFATTVEESRTFHAEWVIDPFLPNGGDDDGTPATGPTLADQVFETATPRLGGPVLCELVMRGYDVSIESLWFGLRVRPKERIPS